MQMNQNDHPYNVEPFEKDTPGHAPDSRETNFGDRRKGPFDKENTDYPVNPGSHAKDDGFYNPMYDVLQGPVPPHSEPPVVSVNIPPDLRRALEDNPQAQAQFERLSSMRRRKIVNSLEHNNNPDRRNEHVLSVVRNLIMESRTDVELGLE